MAHVPASVEAADADERALVEAAKADPRRFADLYELHFDRIYAYIIRRVRDRAEAQDLTSHVFHQALANLKRFEWRGVPFSAWLFRMAANAVATHCQRVLREPEIAPAHYTAQVDMEEIERCARVFQSMRELPDDQRRVLELRFVEQKSIRETAAALQRTEGAVKQLQVRGIENLRARLGGSNG